MINEVLAAGDDISGPWIALFLGAFAGAVFSFFFSEWQSRRRIRARREVLIRALHRQLDMIPHSVSKPDVNNIMSWNFVHVTVIDDLLSGETLDARHDADLIRILTLWRALERRQNEVLAIARNATLVNDLPSWIRNNIYQEAYDLHLGIREYREHIKRLLPPDKVVYTRLKDLQDDYLIWGKPKRGVFGFLPKHPIFRLKLRLKQKANFFGWATQSLSRDSAYRDHVERERKALLAEEMANRDKIRVVFEEQIIPALEGLKQRLNDQSVQFHYGKRVDHDFDSANPGFSENEVASYTSVGMNRRHFAGDDGWYGQFLRAKSTPKGIAVDLVGRDRDESSYFYTRGWSIPIARSFQDFTPQRVEAVILQQYIDTLASQPRKQFRREFFKSRSRWPQY